MKIFTIGFTKTDAQGFFGRLRRSGARMLADVRLNNVSQLAGFAKRDDLAWFARELADMDYRHLKELAPTKPMLDALKKEKGDWATYERAFLDLMAARRIERHDPAMLDGACLLCSEDTPHHCHRRLVAEYLQAHWPQVEIIHL
ncbi:MAG: DUF488 domain-containing protein [Sphingomonas bacterium]|nr:DUF488 domain-containing protein [Sphingomonas bacterium]